MSDNTHELLRIMLDVAVPLAILDLESHGGITDWHAEQCRGFGEVLGSEGDTILYAVKNKTAHNFAQLAERLAIMAFFPGGVKIGRSHYQAKEEFTYRQSINQS